MSGSIGKYTFNAWLRRGVAGRINEPDTFGLGGSGVAERATVPIDVQVNTRALHKDFALLAPGDVIGINPDAVVRTEPRDWVTDFEPNYLAFIEFYDEDFVFRYTPARAVGDRLRPWLALLVLEEETTASAGEFTRTERQLPLPSIMVASSAALPSHTQTWAWAHVHTNEDFASATDFERFLLSLSERESPNADRILCRLMSPRRLRANTPYAAFVVPAFETGRLAGLGQDPSAIDAQQPSWTDAPGSVEFPIYYQWRFRTGENEDFESLVKRLEPKAAPSLVGIRGMDGEKPGWGMASGADLGPILPADEKQSVIGLEGALKAPTTRPRPEVIQTSRRFFGELAQALNLPETLRDAGSVAELPVVSPPIYGEHHALRHRIDVTQSGWLDALNRDPRTRVAAGFGTRVVQDHQEDYVARAWAQVQKVLEANRIARLASYAMHASRALYANLGARLEPSHKLAFFSPLLRKIRGSPTTLQHQIGESRLPFSALSGAMRRLVRPRGAFAKRISATDPSFSYASLLTALAEGRLTAAPPKTAPGDLPTDRQVASALPKKRYPRWLRLLIRGRVLLLIVALLLLAIIGLQTGAWLAVAALGALAIAAFVALERLARRAEQETERPATLTDPETMATAAANAPERPGFEFVEIDPVVVAEPAPGTRVTIATESTSDSPRAMRFTRVTTFTPGDGDGDTLEARDFRHAAALLGKRTALTVPPLVRTAFDLRNADAKLTAAVDPSKAFPRRVAATVKFAFDPTWLLDPEHLVPAMAYPDFDDPMYEKLRDLSSELLLPNLEQIAPNTLTLLETNPAFIEAYLVGLNCELGKELLWREYPTDRRGSYFRQFWDVRGIIPASPGKTAAELAELGRDVSPLDQWPLRTALGTHQNPLRAAGEQVVLAVRGDLLEKYPDTLIYAQKAHRGRDGRGRPLADPMVNEVASEADMERELKFPAFKAAVEPDIRFFGFDLTLEQARGDEDPREDADDWGWYFVIQQLPGEPRFGMDVSFSPDTDPSTPITWNDLAWTLFPDSQPFIDTSVRPASFIPSGAGERLSQWGADSATMASILCQRPVMILVHAREMLEGLG